MKLFAIALLLLVTYTSQGQPYYKRKAPVSKYVSHNEAYNSPTAKSLGIQNVPTEQQEKVVRYVARYHVDPLREELGSPLYIASFFRNALLNAAVKGSKYSDHLANNGIAGLDIDQDGRPNVISNVELFHYIRNNVYFYKLIWEFGTNEKPAWVHVSFSMEPMKNTKAKVYRAIRLKNKTVYEIIAAA